MKAADFLQLVLLGAIWGASFLFTRIAVPSLGPTWLVAIRIGSAALFLFATACILRRAMPWRGNARHYLILGVVNTGLPFLLFAYAATSLTASLLSIINSTAPLWGALIGAALTRVLPSPGVLLGLGAGTAGVALLVFKGDAAARDDAVLPALAALAAPFCYGLASHYARLRTSHIEPLAVAQGSMWGALAGLLPAVLVADVPAMPSPGIGLAALTLGIVCTGLAYLMYFRLVRDIGATPALTVTFLIPLFGILWGALFLDEPVGPSTLLGGLLVLAGTALVTGFDPRPIFAGRRRG